MKAEVKNRKTYGKGKYTHALKGGSIGLLLMEVSTGQYQIIVNNE